MKNPIINAKIVPNFNPLDYTKRKHKRGEKEFVMSRSQLKEFAACPSKWIKGGGDEGDSTTSTDWGTLVDALVTGDRVGEIVAIHPDTYPAEEKGNEIEKPWNMNSKWCRAWAASHAGRIIISQETFMEAQKAAELLYRVLEIELNNAKTQVFVSGEYRDKETGLVIPICGLIDLAPSFGPSIKDIKTARSADLARWARVVHEHWYHVQAAIYLDLWNAATSEDRNEFDHLIQENRRPYEIAHCGLSIEFLKAGRETYKNALRLYCQCLSTGHWATYNDIAPGLKVGGKVIIDPESWMVERQSTPDPDWLSDKQAA